MYLIPELYPVNNNILHIYIHIQYEYQQMQTTVQEIPNLIKNLSERRLHLEGKSSCVSHSVCSK